MKLEVTNGTLTLNGTTGLDFSSACSGAAGDGTAGATMTFCGSITDINNAMNGMSYDPTLGFSGSATLTITSNDQGNSTPRYLLRAAPRPKADGGNRKAESQRTSAGAPECSSAGG